MTCYEIYLDCYDYLYGASEFNLLICFKDAFDIVFARSYAWSLRLHEYSINSHLLKRNLAINYFQFKVYQRYPCLV